MSPFLKNIEPYLDNELSEREAKDFEQALRTDTRLQNALALEKATRATMYLMVKEQIKKKRTASEPVVVTPTLKVAWKKWAIAASLIGVALLGALYLFTPKTNNQELAMQYTYDFPVPKEQGSEVESSEITLFFTDIANKNYKNAVFRYENLSEIEKQKEDLMFFLAFSQLKNKQYKEAIASFDKIKNPTPKFQEAIEWYRLMAKLGDNQDIRAALITIANDNSKTYQKQAAKLIARF